MGLKPVLCLSSQADSDSNVQTDFGASGPDPSAFLPFSFHHCGPAVNLPPRHPLEPLSKLKTIQQ